MLTLLCLLALGAVIAAGSLVFIVGIIFKVLFELVLLPFRLIGLLLFLPLLILKVVFSLFVGLVVGIPLLVVGIIGTLFAVVFSPLLPLLAIGALLWLLVRASTPRPALPPSPTI